jgi:protein-disulfide isomerase
MRWHGAFRGFFLVALTIVAPVPLAAERAGDADVVARVGNEAITLTEVDRRALVQDAARFRGLRLRDALYEARKRALDGLIADRLVAAAAGDAGVSADVLIEREIGRGLVPVTERDVDEWYRANTARLNGASLEQVSSKIREALEDQRRQEARDRFIERLRAATTVRISLDPPREALTIASDEPSTGPAAAPVQIVMYSDFQCPFCARVGPTLTRLREAYGERVRIVYRDFPLASIHPRATAAAAAAQCAHAQGRFWAYYDHLFASGNRLETSDFTQYAGELGLDVPRFTACTTDTHATERVKGNLASGERLGVSATPAFFINGRFLPGAQPFETFKRVIDEELADAGRGAVTAHSGAQP